MTLVNVACVAFFFSLSFASIPSFASDDLDHCDRALFSHIDGLSKHAKFSMREPSVVETLQVYNQAIRFASLDSYRATCTDVSRACHGSQGQTRFDVHRSFDSFERLLSIQTRSQTVIAQFKTASGIDAEVYETIWCSTAPGLDLRCSKTCSIVTEASWGT